MTEHEGGWKVWVELIGQEVIDSLPFYFPAMT